MVLNILFKVKYLIFVKNPRQRLRVNGGYWGVGKSTVPYIISKNKSDKPHTRFLSNKDN